MCLNPACFIIIIIIMYNLHNIYATVEIVDNFINKLIHEQHRCLEYLRQK